MNGPGVRRRRIAQTNTEQKDRLFHALAQATESCLVNAPDFPTGINLAIKALGEASGVDRIYIFKERLAARARRRSSRNAGNTGRNNQSSGQPTYLQPALRMGKPGVAPF
ncbi:MAG: hypothetical protein U0X20_23385 [Caldilineaceae bacterium]